MQLSPVELAVITSACTLGGALLTACIAGIYNLRAKRTEYVNDYYKKVIDRRMAAYEQLENLVVALKSSVVGEDNKPYHLLFSPEQDGDKALLRAFQLVHAIASQGLWLSEKAFEKARDLGYLLLHFKPAESSATTFGKLKYRVIAELREALENIMAADLLELHDVKKFLTRKKNQRSGFHAIKVNDDSQLSTTS